MNVSPATTCSRDVSQKSSNVVDKKVAQRQAASRHLKDLVSIGVLEEIQVGKEKLFIHPKLMQLLSRDSNEFKRYAD